MELASAFRVVGVGADVEIPSGLLNNPEIELKDVGGIRFQTQRLRHGLEERRPQSGPLGFRTEERGHALDDDARRPGAFQGLEIRTALFGFRYSGCSPYPAADIAPPGRLQVPTRLKFLYLFNIY